VRVIVSQAPGSSIDIAARVLAAELAPMWGQQLIVDNRAGGQNVIGAQAAARASPDGYTLFFGTSAALITNQYLFKSLPYDPQKDFAPVALIGLSVMVVTVNPAVPAGTLRELIELDKAAPGKLALAHEGPKSATGMVSRMLQLTAGTQFLEVQYNGAPKGIQDTIAGNTQIMMVSSAAVMSFLHRNALRALAVSTASRMPGLEHVPTLGQIFPGFDYNGWYAVVAPAATPSDIVQRINRDINRALGSGEAGRRLRELGLVFDNAGTPESTAEFFAAEHARWNRLIREIGLEPE
jgi:tripartite-type tricarboxylate transporter receptor subunit TctC